MLERDEEKKKERLKRGKSDSSSFSFERYEGGGGSFARPSEKKKNATLRHFGEAKEGWESF